MRAAIFASLIPAPDTDEERERLEDLIATIVDWDQVKDGNQISESANQRTTQHATRPPEPGNCLDWNTSRKRLPILSPPTCASGARGCWNKRERRSAIYSV
jgi:hypothetical protein